MSSYVSTVKCQVTSQVSCVLCIWTVIGECGFFKLVLEVQFLCFWTLIFSNFLRFFKIIFRFFKIFSFFQNYFSFFFEKFLCRKSCFCVKIRDFNILDYTKLQYQGLPSQIQVKQLTVSFQSYRSFRRLAS